MDLAGHPQVGAEMPEWPGGQATLQGPLNRTRLTSSFRAGPSPVSTQARQRLPPWIPRKMGTWVRSRPLLGSMQIFSGKEERRAGGEGAHIMSSGRAVFGQELGQGPAG